MWINWIVNLNHSAGMTGGFSVQYRKDKTRKDLQELGFPRQLFPKTTVLPGKIGIKRTVNLNQSACNSGGFSVQCRKTVENTKTFATSWISTRSVPRTTVFPGKIEFLDFCPFSNMKGL